MFGMNDTLGGILLWRQMPTVAQSTGDQNRYNYI